MISTRSSLFGSRRRGSFNDYSGYSGYGSSSGGYDLGGVWRPHTGRHEMVFDKVPYDYLEGVATHPFLIYGIPPANPIIGDYYQSLMDYYGAYDSLLIYEEQLRRMQDISEADRIARWKARLQFEELCDKERFIRYQRMAEEERMRIGLKNGSHWASRYGSGYGPCGSSNYQQLVYPSRATTHWGSSRLPLSSPLANRFGQPYRRECSSYGTSNSMAGTYRALGGLSRNNSSYGQPLIYKTGSMNSNILRAQIDEARRLRRHARECARQSRRELLCY